MEEDEHLYSLNKKFKCKKTSKESAEKLFELLGIDLVDGEIIHIGTRDSQNKKISDVLNNQDEQKSEPKTRGVKKGIKRGNYNTKNIIKNPMEITFRCKLCDRENTYIRKGKRIRQFCNDACRQKYGRMQRKMKEINRRKSLI